MHKTRFIVAAAVAALAIPASADAASVGGTSLVGGTVADSLSVSATTAPAMTLSVGATSPAALGTITVLDTTPATAHTVDIADAASAYPGAAYPAGHTAGHMDKLAGLGSVTSLANPVEVAPGTDLVTPPAAGAFAALTGTAQQVSAGGSLPVSQITDVIPVWFRQTVNSNEALVSGDTYQLIATYTVNG